MNARLVALQNRRAELLRQTDALLESASAEERELTPEEQASIDERMADIEKLNARIAVEERLANQRAGIEPSRETPGINRVTNAPTSQGFESLGDLLCAVVRASQPGHVVDSRLIRATGSGMHEGSAADGGYLVQTDQAEGLLRRAFDTGILSRRVRKISIGANANSLKMNAVLDHNRTTGSRYGGLQLYWTEEGGLKTPSSPKFRQMTLNLKKLIGLCYATDELLEDATALESVINEVFPEEFGFVFDDAIYNGTGAGMPLGILNAPCLVKVAKESGQAASTIVFENVLKMYTRFWSKGKTGGAAAWFGNNQVMTQLMKMSVGGTATVYGMPVFIPPGGVNGSPYASLMGFPIIEIEQAPALGTPGDLMLADLSQYVMIEKGGLKRASSMHVRFIYDEMTFRFVYRCDGQPTWDVAVTPFVGSDTLSPFVTTDTRS